MGEVIKKGSSVEITDNINFFTITSGSAAIELDNYLTIYNGTFYYYQTYTKIDLINVGGGSGLIALISNNLSNCLFCTVTSDLQQYANSYYYCDWTGSQVNILYDTQQSATFFMTGFFRS